MSNVFVLIRHTSTGTSWVKDVMSVCESLEVACKIETILKESDIGLYSDTYYTIQEYPICKK